MAITAAKIEEIRQKLLGLQQIDDSEREVTKQDAIRILARAIAQVQRRGHSINKVADLLTELGLDISVSTLKSYLSKTAKRNHRIASVAKTKSIPSVTSARPPDSKSSGRLPLPTKESPDVAVARSGSFRPREDSTDI
jgi:hypothetical protein